MSARARLTAKAYKRPLDEPPDLPLPPFDGVDTEIPSFTLPISIDSLADTAVPS
jgi:hypothetical protein